MRRLGWTKAAALAVVAGGITMVGGHPASGQQPPSTATAPPEPSDVAAAIADAGWYADGDAVGDREQLADVAGRLTRRGQPMGFALLAEEPPRSSTTYAERVLDALVGRPGHAIRTVVVLSDADVGVASDVWSDAAIDRALDATIDDLRADPTDGLEALARALAAEPQGTTERDDDTTGGGPSIVLVAVAGLAVGGIAFARRALTGRWGDSYDDDDRRRRSRWGGPSYRRPYGSSYRSSSRSSRSSSRRTRSSGSSRSRSSGGSRSSRGRGGRRL